MCCVTQNDMPHQRGQKTAPQVNLGARLPAGAPPLMRLTGLEPACLATLEPKSNVSANSTTGAYLFNSSTVVPLPKSDASASSAIPAFFISLFHYSTVVPLPKSIASANSAIPASAITVSNYTTRSPDCQAGERAKHQPFCAW